MKECTVGWFLCATNNNVGKSCCSFVVLSAKHRAPQLKVNLGLSAVLRWSRQCNRGSHNVVQGCVTVVYLSCTMLLHGLGSDTSHNQTPQSTQFLCGSKKATLYGVINLLWRSKPTVLKGGRFDAASLNGSVVSQQTRQLGMSGRNTSDYKELLVNVLLFPCGIMSWLSAGRTVFVIKERKVRWKYLLFSSNDRQTGWAQSRPFMVCWCPTCKNPN